MALIEIRVSFAHQTENHIRFSSVTMRRSKRVRASGRTHGALDVCTETCPIHVKIERLSGDRACLQCAVIQFHNRGNLGIIARAEDFIRPAEILDRQGRFAHFETGLAQKAHHPRTGDAGKEGAVRTGVKTTPS